MNSKRSRKHQIIKFFFFLIFLTLNLSEFSEVYPSSDSLNQPILFPGWPKFFSREGHSDKTFSLVLANLDTLSDLEIVGGFYDSLYVWRFDGTNLNNWPIMVKPELALFRDLPAIGDMDGNGELDIAITKWRRGQFTSFLHVFDKNGSLIKGFPVEFTGWSATAPALYDLDGDGKLEIIASGQVHYDLDTLVYVYDYKGEILPGWPQRVANLPYEYIAQQPAVGDLDGDGKPEIVATGSQCIYAWHIDGTPVKGWPVKAESGFYFGWLHHVVLSDLDNDGYLEVLACAFHEYPEFNGYVAVWRYDGTYMPGFPKYYEFEPNSTPIPGDIDNDGYKEIVFVTGEFVLGLPNIHVLRIDGTEMPGWPVYHFGANYDDLALADFDGDNSVDIILTSNYASDIFVYHNDGTLITDNPMAYHGSPFACPNFNDINKDSILDLALLTGLEGYYVYLFNMNVPYHPEKILWGKLFHDNYNTNNTEFGVIRKKGDFNNNGSPDITDVIFLLNYLFKNGKKPGYPYQADVNCNSRINVSDLLQLYNYLFKNGKPLCSS